MDSIKRFSYQYGSIVRSFIMFSSMSYISLQYIRTRLELKHLKIEQELYDSKSIEKQGILMESKDQSNSK